MNFLIVVVFLSVCVYGKEFANMYEYCVDQYNAELERKAIGRCTISPDDLDALRSIEDRYRETKDTAILKYILGSKRRLCDYPSGYCEENRADFEAQKYPQKPSW